MADDKLTPRQEKFAHAWCTNGHNALRAAIAAGYSEKGAGQQGCELLKIPKVKKKIDEIYAEQLNVANCTEEWIIKQIMNVAGFDFDACLDEDGNLLPMHQIPEAHRLALNSIEMKEWDIGGVRVGKTKKVRTSDKIKALELLGKYRKMFTEKHEVTGEISLAKLVSDFSDDDEEEDDIFS